MPEEIIQLGLDDFEEMIGLLNLAFSQAHGPHDFETLLPNLYRPTEEHMRCHWAIRRDGRICSVVGAYPMNWRVGKADLRMVGIGGVSTHPHNRGRGYMSRLMRHVEDRLKEDGVHLSYLSGQRQRYQAFGYERCGVMTQYSFTSRNFRDNGASHPAVQFEEIRESDRERLAHAKQLHDDQEVFCDRTQENFHRICTGWNNQLHAVLNASHQMIGYLVCSANGDLISEMCATDDEHYLAALLAWTTRQGQAQSTLSASPYSSLRLYRKLGQLAERVTIHNSGNWQVFDWATVLQALLNVHTVASSLLTSNLDIEIAGHGTIRIESNAGILQCSRSDAKPTMSCDTPTAMRLLFGPLPASTVMEIPPDATALQALCPIPLGLTRPDHV